MLGLNKKKEKIMKEFKSELEEKQYKQLCMECHKEYGCSNEHHNLLYDTGICTECGNLNDVVNCKIANKVVKEDINPHDYWRSGIGRIIKTEWWRGKKEE